MASGDQKSQKRVSRIALVGVGTVFASMILSGLLLGYLLDGWLDTRPIFMLIFAILGFVGGVLKVHKLLA